MTDQNDIKHKYREFLDLMPLTLALAGLPQSEAGRYYTSDQIEARALSLKAAYKVARQTVRECLKT